jgi:hypothetical protein
MRSFTYQQENNRAFLIEFPAFLVFSIGTIRILPENHIPGLYPAEELIFGRFLFHLPGKTMAIQGETSICHGQADRGYIAVELTFQV